jgi:chromosome segregation ATPase
MAEEALKAIRDQKSEVDDELRRHKEAGSVAENRQNELRTLVTNCETAVQNCIRAEKDRYAAYGNDIQKVVERINKTHWQGEKPLGPFGIHVKVRDNQWAELLRFQLGSLLSSFAVTDTRDLPVLKKILAEHGK